MKKVITVFDGIAVLSFIAMVAVVCMQIVCRYLLRVSVPWTEELCRLLFMYVGFLGTALAVREKELITVDFVLARLPEKLRRVANVVISVFMFAFFALVFVGAIKMYITTRNTYYATMPRLSNGWMYVSAIIGMGASLAGMVLNWIKSFKKGGRKSV